jgi:Leucine rich repeat
MNNSSINQKKRPSIQEGMVAVELNDSFDVEESVTSSAVFLDSPDNKSHHRTPQSDAAPAAAVDFCPLPPPPALLGPSLVETSADEEGGSAMLDTSLLVDDAMLGVTAPAPASAAKHPGTPPSNNSNSNDHYKGEYVSKVPTTITLPHSVDSSCSTGTVPPLASPLDGDDEEASHNNNSGDPKHRLLVCTDGGLNGATLSGGGSANALRKRRRCLLLTAVAALLVLAAVAGTLAYLLGKSSNQGGGGGESNSNSTSSVGSGGSNNGGDSDNQAEDPPTTGEGSGSNNGGQGGAGNAGTTPAPVGTLAPTPSPIASTELYRVALQVTPREVLDDPSTPQGMAIRWLLQPTSSSSTASNYTSPSEAKMLQRYAVAVLEMALNPNSGGGVSTTTADSRAATNTSLNVGPLPGYESKDECEWFGIVCDTVNSTDAGSGNSTNSSASQQDLAGVVNTLNWANRNMEGKIPTEIGLLTSLTTLDLGNNRLRGWIPYSIYNLTRLQYLYLHQNQLSGPISNRVSNLTNLVRFYAGNNQLTGTLPRGFASPGRGAQYARPLRTCVCVHCRNRSCRVLWSNPPVLASSRTIAQGT